jgi:fido (protein-threonine AMPylation protein)
MSAAPINPYRDDNGVLRNTLGITGAGQLREVEYQLTRIRALELQVEPIPGKFDLEHLKAIHKHLFQDVYAWAGQEREINVSKKSLTEPGWKTVFADKDAIAQQAGRAVEVTRSYGGLQDMESEAFAGAITEVYAQWNAAHPFPEGNGRALNTMLTQLAKETGHSIDFRRMPGDFWLDAAEKSLQRVNIDNPRQTRAADTADMKEIFEYITDPQPDAVIRLEVIRANVYEQPDRSQVQSQVMAAVKQDPQWFIEEYKRHKDSFEGRYVAADLFKETFQEYAASKESRNRYNGPVHNSAAVLSSELFKQNLQDKSEPRRDVVVFLTGTPGAGKTSQVLANGQLDANVAMVFEGQMSNPVTSIQKIQQVLDAGLKPVIHVVHALPENALGNTLKRYDEVGRGASINVMGSIQGQLPSSLIEIQKQYADAVQLIVSDVRDRNQPQHGLGWKNIELLQSEGNHEHIKQRLSTALEQGRAAGVVKEGAYRQAAGLTPLDRDIGLVPKNDRQPPAHVPERGSSPGRGQEAVLSQERDRGR